MNYAQLPVGWTIVRLADVCRRIIGGGTPPTVVQRYWNGQIPWISSADIYGLRDIRPRRKISNEAIRDSATNILHKGGIVVVTRVGLGKLAIAPFDLCFSQDSQGLELYDALVLGEYALLWLSRAVQTFKHESRGTTVNGVTKKQLQNLQILLPPLREQRRIVAKIEELFSELDKGIEILKNAQQQLKVYRQAVLKWAFEGRLTGGNVEEGELPKGWRRVKLGTVIEQPRYGTSRKCDYNPAGKGVLRIPNISNGIVDDSDLKFAEFDQREIQTYELKRGDLLTIRSNGSVGLVGKCCLVTAKDEDYLFAGYLIRLRPLQARILSRFLYYVLSSQGLRVQIEARAKSTSGVNNINSDELRSLTIPICPISKQRRIVSQIESRLSVVDKLEEAVSQSLQQADTFRQSILNKAFEGRLVPQDPTDEPAGRLLKRIKAGRTRRPPQRKAREKKVVQ